MKDRLENSGCHFSSGEPTAIFSYYAQSGTVIDAFMFADFFSPALALYTSNSSTPIAVKSGSSATELKYDISLTGTYYLYAFSASQNTTSGPYELDFYCANFCHAPFETVPLPFITNADYGGVVSLTAQADGTGPLHYRWFDTTDPGKTLGDDSAMFITPALYHDTKFGVHISNSCGQIDDFANVKVAACGLATPAITDQPMSGSIVAGGSWIFTVKAIGTSLHYQWFEGISGSTSSPIGVDLPGVQLYGVQQTTPVWVRVSNTCGHVDSATAAAIVVPVPRHRGAQH